MPPNRYKVTNSLTGSYAYAKDGQELDQIILEMVYSGAPVDEIKIEALEPVEIGEASGSSADT
jgi:hypothetical protein